jgi:hypothetical protein
MKVLIFFENLKILKSIKIFIFASAHSSYGHDEGIKSHLLTLRISKKHNISHNNEYKILEMKVKNDQKLIFFVSKPIAKIDTSACKM